VCKKKKKRKKKNTSQKRKTQLPRDSLALVHKSKGFDNYRKIYTYLFRFREIEKGFANVKIEWLSSSLIYFVTVVTTERELVVVAEKLGVGKSQSFRGLFWRFYIQYLSSRNQPIKM
jgi:hypothetical protein